VTTQAQKATAFRALHQREGAFIIPNPWDAGTARLLDNCARIAAATPLPVSADLENCYAHEPRAAAERVHAAAEVARSLPFPFMLTARAENYLHGRRDLDDTIRRLQAFEKAGADVLYAPGLRDLATMRIVVSSLAKPVNVVMSAADPAISAAQLAGIGVKRISVGGALSRLALAFFLKAAREMKEEGRFTWMTDTVPAKELSRLFIKR